MTRPLFRRVLRGYREIGARIGALVLLVALSAALGALIALPLWLFATSSPRFYAAAVIAAAAAAAGAALVRRLARTGVRWSRAAARALAVLLGLVKAVLLLAGLYAAAAFAVRRLYLPAAAGGLVFLAAAGWIGWGVRSSTPNRSEASSGVRSSTPNRSEAPSGVRSSTPNRSEAPSGVREGTPRKPPETIR